jgi:hypothetical protein
VRIDGGNTTSSALYQYSFGNSYSHALNNIFSNEAGGLAICSESATDLEVSDHNALYTTGTHLVNHGGTLYTDLVAWQASTRDIHSVQSHPMWVGTTGFAPTNAALNAAATPVAEVTTDIQGQARDPMMPDIGCDEFELFSDDVGILSINYPVQPFPAGENTVFIKFANNGQDTLTSMQVDWEVDGNPQPTYFWTGLLPSAATYDSLDIGIYDFAAYAPHTIKVWVSNPNDMTDGLASNDTLEVNGLYPALLGEYTIGGSSPDFDSITQAVDALTLGGAAGPVTFNIRSGTYLEPMVLTTFPGCGCDTPVVFQSESGDSTDVTITNLGYNNTTITLNGADGLIFRHLTLTSVNPAFRRVIEYFNGAHCNQFHNNRILGYEGTSNSSSHAVIWSNTSLDTANVFRNNWIRHGAYGFYLIGSSSGNANTMIENNFLDQNYDYGIYAHQESGISILQNEIAVDAANQNAQGVTLSECHGQINVLRNKIHAPSGYYGIHLSGCNGSAMTRGLTANNFVIAGGTNNAYSVYVNSSSYQDVVYNNLHVHTSNVNPASNAAIYLTSNTSLNFLNNVAVNSGSGWAVYANGNNLLTSDYNDLFAAGAFLGQWNGANQAELSDWQSASGQDVNSLSQNPQFMSEVDLHVSNILLNATATPLGYVAVDID